MTATGASDRGRRRRQNEDSYQIDVIHAEEQALCVICDGMGGAKAGGVASEMSIQLFTDEVKKRWKPGMTSAFMKSVMEDAVESANALVFEKSEADSRYNGMGTTIVAAFIDGEDAVFMNIGDSRAYIIKNQEIARVTNDHSLAEELYRQGKLTKQQAENYPAKNLITRVVGTDPSVEPEFYSEKLAEGDIVLLCSDGLSNMVEEQEMLYEVLQSEELDEACGSLIALANERGGPDNITVVLLRV